jgi:hypothetical protein
MSKSNSNNNSSNSYAKEFEEWLNSEGSSRYIKLKRDMPTAVRLKSGVPERMEYKKLSEDGKLVAVAIYKATTPDEPTSEKEFSVSSKRLARQLRSQTERGFREFEITKRGEGMHTEYEVIPKLPST